MPADEVTHGADVDESRVRTGPRHAAPKKPLFTRFHMPAGKAIAMAAMPTAVLMGMGFTSSLALADSGGSTPTAKSLTADEYKNCVAALDGSSASPSPSASASTSASADQATPSPSASTGTSKDSSATGSGSGTASSSDSGSDDKATPSPSATDGSGKDTSGGTATPSPSASASSSSGGGLLGDLGDAITGIFTGGSGSDSGSSSSASPSPSASASSSTSDTSTKDSTTSSASGAVKDTTKKVTDTVKKTTDTATDAAKDVTKSVEKAAETATSSPSPSASPSTDAQNCPAATEDVSGVDNKVPVADDPWYLNASSLLLKGADYQGVVEVKTAGGTTKKVLKYVISGGTDIGDLHQTVKDKQQGKTYHVQAGSGTTSTIRDGDTTMYTESISGNLFGLIPITFSPDSPPPLNIPLIYFTNVKVVQAAQFGGTLHVPGMHVYTTDGTG
ncbi:hypothetical protein [Streptomyces sp. CdTB01]|uniref:hypothetical protein n=1 Tax=Streptomyces sp. CdTB01 TaxID=1725411 RepID=UPI00073AA6C9|nr:hypothetical protein [Streptomyces sp. CdTB01]ALV33436.1 hypothetical protein AS200_16380 [Streptomyces sp. CdTB01]